VRKEQNESISLLAGKQKRFFTRQKLYFFKGLKSKVCFFFEEETEAWNSAEWNGFEEEDDNSSNICVFARVQPIAMTIHSEFTLPLFTSCRSKRKSLRVTEKK